MLRPILAIVGFIEIFFTIFFHTAVGISPDFPRQAIEDKPDINLKDIDINPGLKSIISSKSLPIDIISSTYVSDGVTLNGTFWLRDPIYNNMYQTYVKNNLSFTVFIYTDDKAIAPTYRLIISPQDGTWKSILSEIEPEVPSEPFTSQRIIDTNNNYTGFFEDGNRYVDFSIDLGKISYPSSYWLDLQTSTINPLNDFKFVDNTFIYRAPPLESKIDYDWEKPIEIRPGSEQTFKLFINSTDLPLKQTQLFTDANSTDGIHISFNPKEVSIESTGKNTSNMRIRVDENVHSDTQTKVDQIINISAKTEENVTRTNLDTLIIPIELLPPLSIGDFLLETKLLYIIPIGVTALIVLWVSKKIDKVKDYGSFSVEDLLNADATVIAGVLIFLTIGSAEFSYIINKIGILTASIVFPFAMAAVRTLIKGDVEPYGIKFMIAGFIYLMTSVIVIGFVNL